MFQFKRLMDIDEMKSVQSIEKQVWDSAPTPIHQTYTAAKNGGLVLWDLSGLRSEIKFLTQPFKQPIFCNY